MNSRQKRHPLIRFVRGIVRLFKVIFRPKQKNLKSPEDYQHELRMAELDRRRRELEDRDREQLITVGELFKRVKWQTPQSTIVSGNVPVTSAIPQARDVSRN
jgi:hypothetical protein